jgi:hypothetical protein
METEVAYSPGGFVLEQAHPAPSRLWALDNDRLTIGRDPSSDIFVDDTRVSRHHADLIHHRLDWSIVDIGSTNGTYVNGARVREAVLRPGDRIQLGDIQLVLRRPGAGPSDRQGRAVRYDVGWQQGNISNVAGNQSNFYHESSLRYIASRRGRARLLIIWGLLLFFIGSGLGLYDVLSFDSAVFNSISSTSFNPPSLPPQFIPLFGLAALLNLLGIALFIFGLITRSGAKREARRVGADWP